METTFACAVCMCVRLNLEIQPAAYGLLVKYSGMRRKYHYPTHSRGIKEEREKKEVWVDGWGVVGK